MPFSIPTLSTVRSTVRNYIQAALNVPLIPNDVPRVLADALAGVAHEVFQYVRWLSNQFLPDTASAEFLDKWATLFLTNSDGSIGRKVATYATGTATITASVAGTILPAGTQFTVISNNVQVIVQTTTVSTIGTSPTTFPIRSFTAGAVSNLAPGTILNMSAAIPGLNASSGIVVSMSGGADEETDAELRPRVLDRLRQPPMGGDASDYEAWALSVPGVTRAWCSANEMGPGTVTIRIMCDDLRATTNPMTSGLPTSDDIAAVQTYLNTVRPVTVADLFVVAPIPAPVSFAITNFTANSVSMQNAITAAVASMIASRGRPAQTIEGTMQPASTIYRAWVSDAVLAATGGSPFDLHMVDYVPAHNGVLPVMGSVTNG